MASPFKVFRKHQKLMLAFLGVFVMIGFVILPVIMQGMGQRRSKNPLVVGTSKYGDLHDSNLRGMRWRRQVAIRFLEALGTALIMAEGDPSAVRDTLQQMAPSENVEPTGDQALVETWLLARRAEELGLVIDDRAINAFITELMQGRLSGDDLKGIFDRTGLGEDAVFAALHDELLAIRLKRMFLVSLQGVTPAQRWDYFQRLNRAVTIESLPVPVADFVGQLPDPDDATLREFFERYRDQLVDPTSPDPGFREPRRVDVEYLKADYESFFDRQMQAITPEEVAEYYEENKENYRRTKLPTLDEEESATADEEVPPSEEPKKEAEKSGTTEPETSPSKPEAPTPNAETPPREPTSPAASEAPASAPPSAMEETPADAEEASGQEAPGEQGAGTNQESSAGESDAEPPSPERAAPPPKGKPAAEQAEPAPANPVKESTSPVPGSNENTSLPRRESPFRLASFAEEGEPAEPAKSEPTPGAEEPPAIKTAPAEQPKTEPEKPSEKPAEKPTAGADVAPAPEPEYLPLEQVESEIRRALARERTGEKIDSLLSDLRNTLAQYQNKLILYQVDAESKAGGESSKPPERPDFAALAKEHGLTVGRTGLVSALDVGEWDIGESRIGGAEFLEAAFELPKHRPEISRDSDLNRYLFWKLDDVEERTPDFDEPGVRERVLRRWKLIEARGLAVQKAEQMAAEARKAQKPLSDVFGNTPDVAVTETKEPFTWLTYGSLPAWLAQGAPWISEVEGVDAPGNEFMQAVFSLEKGNVGTAMNEPKTTVYVVRVTGVYIVETDTNVPVTGDEAFPSLLWSKFVAESYRSYAQAGSHDRYLAYKSWLDGIRSEAGLHWSPEWLRESSERQRPSE